MQYARAILVVAGLIGLANGQTLVDLRTQSKSIDFSGANVTKPFQSGTVLPATCLVDQAFFQTNAPAGLNLYGCTAVNSWTLLSAGVLTGDVTGAPNASTVSRIQGRTISGAAPASGQSLVWNSSTSSWTPQTITGVQGPQGPQGTTGSQGPTGSTGAQGAAGTNGAIAHVQNSGTNLPVEPSLNFTGGGCVDDPTNNRTDCTGAGISGLNIALNGTTQGTQSTLNFISGTGIVQSCTNNVGASRVDCTPSYNTALIPTHDTIHADENYQASSNGTTAMTTVSPAKALTSYTKGQCFDFVTDTANPVSVNIDGLGVKSLKLADGATALPAGLALPNYPFTACYDGTLFRLKAISTTTNSAGGGLKESAAVISIDPTQGVETPAFAVGLVGDGATDNTAKFSAIASGTRVHLEDGATYVVGTGSSGGAVNWPSNVTFICSNCSIQYAGAVTNYPFQFTGTNQAFYGVTFDLGGVNTGAYVGSNIANTAVTVTTGGSGFAPSRSFNVGFTGGGCIDQPNGFATANSSGVVTTVTLTRPGADCTSNPTIGTTFTTYPACPRSGACTAPTFSYATPTNTTGPQHPYGVYVHAATNWQCYDCYFTSTGSTGNNLSQYMDGLKLYSSSFTVIRPHVDNTIEGYQIGIDSNGTTNPGKVDTPYLDGSGFDALQVRSTSVNSASNIEIAGGFCTNVTDASFGTGQWGNCYSIFEVSNVKLHDAYAIGPRFSGVRVTGSSSTAQTKVTQFNSVSRMHVLNSGETGIYLELGAEWTLVDGNVVVGCNSGINGDNANERPDNGINFITNNILRDNVAFGIHVVHDKIQGNVVANSPIGYMIGNGGTGYGIQADTNRCYSTGVPGTITTQVCLSPDAGLNNATTNLGISLQFPFASASNGPGTYDVPGPIPVAPLSNYSGPQITAITLANPPVFTFNSGSATIANGQTWILRNIPSATLSDGVTPVNGQLCVIGSAGATSFTCTNLNTTGGVAFTSPLYGNAASTATELYSAGTTQLPWPSQVSLYDTGIMQGALVSADVALSSGWGSSTTSALAGSSHQGTFTITAAGSPSASPVVTLTFPVPFMPAPATCMVLQTGGTFGVLTNPAISAPTSSGVTFTWSGTPVASQVYKFSYSCGV